MGKRHVIGILLAWILLTSTPVLAELSLNGPSKSTINVGDEVTLSGYIIQPKDMIALFKLVLHCEEDQQLVVKTITLKKNARKEYTETVPLFYTTEDQCTIRAELYEQDQRIEHRTSPPFTITTDLTGTFSMDKYLLKLGDTLTITGDISTIDGMPIDGTATISFQQNNVDYHVNAVDIINGEFSYEYTTQEDPKGLYTIKVRAQDTHGNYKIFLIDPFTIDSGITILAETDKFHILPGAKLKVSGDATILDLSLKSGVVRVQFDDKEFTEDVKRGTFSLKIPLSETIPTGKKTLTVFIEDEYGNTGTTELSIIVDPISTHIVMDSAEEAYTPGDLVHLIPRLIDQAQELITADIGVTITTPDNVQVLTDTVESGKPLEFKLLSTAIPGTWKIHLFAGDIKQDLNLYVEEKPALTANIGNETLIIHNNGNVKYRGPVEVLMKSVAQTFTIVKDVSLDVDEQDSIYLADEVPPGTYDIIFRDQTFEKVTISGEVTSSTPQLLYLLVIVILLIIIYVFLKYQPHKRIPKKHRKTKHKKTHHPKHHEPHHHRRIPTDDEHVKEYKQKMSMSYSGKKKRLKFKNMRKGADEYVFELPTKKEQPPEPEQQEPEPYWGNQETKDFDEEYKDYEERYETREKEKEQEEEERENVPEKKKGMFNMFD